MKSKEELLKELDELAILVKSKKLTKLDPKTHLPGTFMDKSDMKKDAFGPTTQSALNSISSAFGAKPPPPPPPPPPQGNTIKSMDKSMDNSPGKRWASDHDMCNRIKEIYGVKKDDEKSISSGNNPDPGMEVSKSGSSPDQEPGNGQLGMGIEKSKSNPDEKSDASLGEAVEHLVEDHMKENKSAEEKEGHDISFEKSSNSGDPICDIISCLHKSELKKANGSIPRITSVQQPNASNTAGIPRISSVQQPNASNTQGIPRITTVKSESLSKPYSSDAQRRWAHTASGKKALGGKAAVKEWDSSSKGKKLPEKALKKDSAKENPINDGVAMGSTTDLLARNQEGLAPKQKDSDPVRDLLGRLKKGFFLP